MSDASNPIKRSVAVGELVCLTPFEPGDFSGELIGWINDTRSNWHLLTLGHPMSDESRDSFVESCKPPNGTAFNIVDRQSALRVGFARLSSIDWISRIAFYGLVLSQPYQGEEAVVFDATRSLIGFGFNNLGLNRIWSPILPLEPKMIEAFEQIGGTTEGTLEQFYCLDGAFRDAEAIAFLRRDFDAARASK